MAGLIVRLMSQHGAPDAIANGENVGLFCSKIRIDFDETRRIHMNGEVFEPAPC